MLDYPTVGLIGYYEYCQIYQIFYTVVIIYLLLGLLAVSLKNVKIWCWCLTCIFIEFLAEFV